MATTTLIFENIVIGCFTWSWVAVLLIRSGTVPRVNLITLLSSLKDYPAPLGIAFLLLVYPVGSMMNTLCYALAKKLFAQRQERKILERFGLNLKDVTPIFMFVAQHGSEQVYASVQSFLPFKRISRAAIPHFFMLACALLTFGRELLPFALLSFGIFALAIPACLQSYNFRNEELMAAYRILQKGSTEPEVSPSVGGNE